MTAFPIEDLRLKDEGTSQLVKERDYVADGRDSRAN